MAGFAPASRAADLLHDRQDRVADAHRLLFELGEVHALEAAVSLGLPLAPAPE